MNTYQPYTDFPEDMGEVPPPKNNHYLKMEEYLCFYYKRGWEAGPCRLEWDKENKKKIVRMPYDLKKEVYQEAHQIYRLRTTETLTLNSLYIKTGINSDLFVLDLDLDTEGTLNAANTFLKDNKIDIYADNYAVKTHSGGMQYYFFFPKKLKDLPTTRSKLFSGAPVDIRGEGGIVFAPPSQIMKNGIIDKYELYLKEAKKLKIHAAPQALIELILNEYNSKFSTETREFIVTDISDLDEAVEFLRKEKLGYDEWFRCMAALNSVENGKKLFLKLSDNEFYKDSNESLERKWDSLRNETNKKCSIGSLYYIAKEHGYVIPKKEKIIIDDKICKTSIQNALECLEEEERAPIEKTEWMVPNLFSRKTVSMCVGHPSSGKTIFTCSWIKNVINGEDLFNGEYYCKDAYNVLFIEGDLPSGSFKEYREKTSLIENTNFKFLMTDMLEKACMNSFKKSYCIENDDCLQLLKKYILKYKIDFIIFDSLASTCLKPGKDESSSKEIIPVLMVLKRLASETNTHIHIIHHLRKPSEHAEKTIANQFQVIGTSALSRYAHWIIGLSNVYDNFGVRKEREGILHIVKEGILGGNVRFPKQYYKITNTYNNEETLDLDSQSVGKVVIDLTKIDEEEKICEKVTNKVDLKILDIVYNGTDIKRNDILNKINGFSTRYIDNRVKALKDLNLLVTDGNTRNTIYKVTNEALKMLGIDKENIFSEEPLCTQ